MGAEGLRVAIAGSGFYPRSLRWQGRGVRVVAVDEVYTCGLERRFRVRTPEGPYELGYDTATGSWRLIQAPTWFQRVWARMQDAPRYPLPAERRRGNRRPASHGTRLFQALARVIALQSAPPAGYPSPHGR
jgi:hypothetical protein